MHPGALATEIQFTAWRAKEGRFETRTRTVTKIHSGTKPARLRRCSSRLRIISARRVVGGSTAVPPAASSCKVPFFHRGEGGTIIRKKSNKDGYGFCVENAWTWDQILREPGSKELPGLDVVRPYRRYDLGPISWCSQPGCQRLPAAACLVTWPDFGSRDHNFGHVTTCRVAELRWTAPQSSHSYCHARQMTTRSGDRKWFRVQNISGWRPHQLPASICLKNIHFYLVRHDAALKLGVGGPCGAGALRAFPFWYAIPPLLHRHLPPPHGTGTHKSVSDREAERSELERSLGACSHFPTAATSCRWCSWPSACPSSDRPRAEHLDWLQAEMQIKSHSTSLNNVYVVLTNGWSVT